MLLLRGLGTSIVCPPECLSDVVVFIWEGGLLIEYLGSTGGSLLLVDVSRLGSLVMNEQRGAVVDSPGVGPGVVSVIQILFSTHLGFRFENNFRLHYALMTERR